MTARRPRFTAIPAIPQTSLTDWQFNVLTAMKENIELLIGARGTDNSARAIVAGQVTLTNPPTQNMTHVSASGTGYTINGVNVPNFEDYNKLISDVQQLANDVANLRLFVSTLIKQLKG